MKLRFAYLAMAAMCLSLVPVQGAMAQGAGKVFLSLDGPKGKPQCLELSGLNAGQALQARVVRGDLRRALAPLTADATALDYSFKGDHQGRVNLNASPADVRLSIDDKPYSGELSKLTLSVGAHVLKFEKDGYKPAERTVVTTPCRVAIVSVNLQELPPPPPKKEPVLTVAQEPPQPSAQPTTKVEATELQVTARSPASEKAPNYEKAETIARIPGEVFKDCPDCPTVIVAPAGQFFMGQHGSLKKRTKRIAQRFAIGQHEVTFADWDQCVAAGGCDAYAPKDEGWGRENRPVINVNWQDAWNYTVWLSQRTGKTYRLPTEMEWEYVAQAGHPGVFWWGDALEVNLTNTAKSGSRYSQKRTALVGSFRSNPFGLYDVIGNVSEWTADCYSISKSNKNSKHCRRAVRGGSWNGSVGNQGVYMRASVHEKLRTQNIGFRVLRELEAQE